MNSYRIWVKDIALQSVVVEAESAEDARKQLLPLLDSGAAPFEEFDESSWEIESVEQITDHA